MTTRRFISRSGIVSEHWRVLNPYWINLTKRPVCKIWKLNRPRRTFSIRHYL